MGIKMKNMILKSFMSVAFGLVMMQATFAQEVSDGSTVILPVEAQACNLPSAPPAIPEVPVKEDLLKAQQNVKDFQASMVVYRDCINKDVDSEELTEGNRAAIAEAHNYSVDMEERVANMFNEAVRAYKAGLAKG